MVDCRCLSWMFMCMVIVSVWMIFGVVLLMMCVFSMCLLWVLYISLINDFMFELVKCCFSEMKWWIIMLIWFVKVCLLVFGFCLFSLG